MNDQYRCFYKEDGKLCQVNATKEYSIKTTIKAVKESLMKDSLPFREAVMIVVK